MVVAAAQTEFGVQALYPVGRTLFGPSPTWIQIALSTSQLVSQGRLELDCAAWRLILVASLSNFVFKGGMAAVIGGRALIKHLAPAFRALFLGRDRDLGVYGPMLNEEFVPWKPCVAAACAVT